MLDRKRPTVWEVFQQEPFDHTGTLSHQALREFNVLIGIPMLLEPKPAIPLCVRCGLKFNDITTQSTNLCACYAFGQAGTRQAFPECCEEPAAQSVNGLLVAGFTEAAKVDEIVQESRDDIRILRRKVVQAGEHDVKA